MWHQSACILCENNCGITIQVEGRRFTKIRGDRDHPHSRGYTCNKALRLDHYANGGHRLTTPLRRETDGSFTEVEWDTALAEIAARLRAVRDAYGGESILSYGGGGQGNHLGGAYRGSVLHLLGAKYRSNALAQEKCGEAWVDAHLTGSHTVGDFEHAEVSVFIGKNPWHSHGIARARSVLRAIAKDPDRTMIVIDPVRTETADLADIHLQVRPGTDVWCLAALVAVIVQEDLVDRDFIGARVRETERVLALLAAVDVSAHAAICGIHEATLRRTARRIAGAASVSTFEDLGVQQGPHSVLVSYLDKLLWLLTGNFGKPGAMAVHSWLAPLAGYDTRVRRTPVTGTAMLAGLIPCNVIADEILSDHPHRFRAMLIDSANPAHSIADSPRFRAALAALELVVVVDVALTETGRLADYVLPASSQYEKWEATFFTLDFPDNVFHLRAPVLDPLPGTLPEPEIYARLVEALHPAPRARLALLRRAARLGRPAYLAAFGALIAADRSTIGWAPYLLYRTLGPTLPEGAAAAALLWPLSLRVWRHHRAAVRRAGFASFNALFDALLAGRSGVRFTRDRFADAWDYLPHADGRIPLAIPELLDALASLPASSPVHTSAEFPFVLMVGQRRAFTANTIFRDPSWRLRDRSGALRVSPRDAGRLGFGDGDLVTVTTARGRAEATVEVDDRLQPGHAALPNGFGLDHPATDGKGAARVGVPPNSLTDDSWRDEYANNPCHKHVPARIEAVTPRVAS